MSTATELRPSPLAERIAKVRNRMLVATLTQVPPSNKELFTALCQIYEQREMEKISFSSKSSDGLLLSLQVLSFTYEMSKNIRQQWSECMLRKTFSQQQEWSDFYDNVGGDDDDFSDWDKAR